MEEQFPSDQSDSIFAAEGTCAHSLGEISVSRRFGLISEVESVAALAFWSEEWEGFDFDFEAMARHAQSYTDEVVKRAALYPNSQVLVEQRMDTGVERCWGTSDIVIVSPEHVEIIDLKYGTGIAVEAEGNSQLRLYALGALDTFGDILGETSIVRITVYQPRLNHVLTEEITPDALRAWRDEVAAPAAALALGDEQAPFGPSEDACRWCPASGRCRAQLEDVFKEDFDSPPDLLTEAEVAETLGRVKFIQRWLKDFEAAALTMAYSEGKAIPGYKVVMSGGRRVISDVSGAVEALAYAGYDADDVAPRKMEGIGKLEKILGDAFDTVLRDFVTKTEGRPSLVLESDRRKSATPNQEAQKEFGS